MSLRDFLFHEEPGITLYCGDCREVLPLIEPLDVVVSDPPYGIGYVHGAEKIRNASRLNEIAVVGDDKPFDPSFLLGANGLILWGANHYAERLPPSGGWLVWDKRCNTVVNDQSDCELAWTNLLRTCRVFYHVWDGFRRQTEKDIPRDHPTQKPVALLTWCLGFVPSNASICDPYCGTGPTLEAAKLTGRRAIGIEIEPKYCEIAVKRLRQEVLTFPP